MPIKNDNNIKTINEKIIDVKNDNKKNINSQKSDKILNIYKSMKTNVMYKLDAFNNRNKKITSLFDENLKQLKKINEEKQKKTFENIEIQCDR